MSTGRTSQLESDKLKGSRLASLAWRCFLPTEGAVAYDAANLPSLDDAALSLMSSSDSDIAMLNSFLGSSALDLACLQGAVEMATAKLSSSLE
jgi:hypothetical protein